MRVVEHLYPLSWGIPTVPQEMVVVEKDVVVERGTLVSVKHLGFETNKNGQECRRLRLEITDLVAVPKTAPLVDERH